MTFFKNGMNSIWIWGYFITIKKQLYSNFIIFLSIYLKSITKLYDQSPHFFKENHRPRNIKNLNCIRRCSFDRFSPLMKFREDHPLRSSTRGINSNLTTYSLEGNSILRVKAKFADRKFLFLMGGRTKYGSNFFEMNWY